MGEGFVFLSHSSADKDFVEEFAERLVAEGFKVWLDVRDLHHGDSLIQAISRAVSSTDYIIAFISWNSVQSSWVTKELSWAMTREVEEHQIRVIPIVLDDCILPHYLRDKLYADFKSRTINEDTFRHFIRSLHVHSCPQNTECAEGEFVGGSPYSDTIRKEVRIERIRTRLFFLISGLLLFGVLFVLISGLYGYNRLVEILLIACLLMALSFFHMARGTQKIHRAFGEDPNLVEAMSGTTASDLCRPAFWSWANVNIRLKWGLANQLLGLGYAVSSIVFVSASLVAKWA